MGQSAEELRRDIERTREDLSGHLDAIGDRVSPGRMVARRRNRMRDGLTGARERVFGSGGLDMIGSGDMGSGTTADESAGMGQRLAGAPGAARSSAEGNPLLAGLIAFGAGFAAAAAFPGSRTEGEAARKLASAASPITEQAKSVGQEVASTLQESGAQAAEQLKSTAAEGAEQVKQAAQSTAASTKEAGVSAAETVRSEAKPDGQT